MKKVINVILALCVLGLAYIFYGSIMKPIRFDQEKTARDKAVIARLIDIRTAQVEFHNQNGGLYTASFDSLIDFVKNGKQPTIAKVGELNDYQLENGWTESKVLDLYKTIQTAKKPKERDQALQDAIDNGFIVKKANGELTYLFSRDTVWNDLIGTIFPLGFNADSLRYVPFGNGAQFEMEVGSDTTKSGSFMSLFEARTLFETYLKGLDKQEVYNLIDERNQLGRYAGMKVGDAISGNNNAGNWE